jgi:hypothetical protein
MSEKCLHCGENEEGLLDHTLVSEDGSKIMLCDYCYQEVAALEEVYGAWREYVLDDGKKYFKMRKITED